MNQYYISRPGESQSMGPMTPEQVRAGLQQGSITQDCLYYDDCTQQWKPLNTMPGLMQYGAPGPAPMKRPMPGTPYPGNTGYTTSGVVPPPGNDMMLSILVTIFCCWPLGIPAILNASKANKAYAVGNYAEYQQAKAAAAKWRKYAIIAAAAVVGLYIAIMMLCFVMS